MIRIIVAHKCVTLVACFATVVSASCASTDPLPRSTVPVYTKGPPLPPAELPQGWTMGSAVTREGLAKTAAMLDTPGLANLREAHTTRTDRLRFFKLVKDPSGHWIAN